MATNNDTLTAEKQNVLFINRAFNLPLNTVWKAFTEPESMKKWWGPKDYTCPYCDIDFRVGGKNLCCMKAADGKEMWSTGTYKEIEPLKKIVITDSFADSKGNIISASELNMPGEWPLECLITLEFEERNGKTNLSLQHVGIPKEMHDDCIKGWQESLDKLERNLR